MAYNQKDSESNKSIVDETLDLFDKYSAKRDNWATQAKEDKEFRLGKQWKREQKEHLESRGQAPIVINRIHPAVESAKAMLTSNRPSFRCAPREDSDNKVAQVMSALLAYMYDISEGRDIVRQAVDDYYVMGIGYFQVYQDPTRDNGKGEVCFHDIDPLDVYVDPNSRHKFFDDAENIIVSRLFTKPQAKKMYPMYNQAIDNAADNSGSRFDFNAPSTQRADDGETAFPEDVGRMDNQDYIRGYERYSMVDIKEIRTFEKFSGAEEVFEEKDFENYLKRPAWIINGQPIMDEKQAKAMIEQLQLIVMQEYDNTIVKA